MTDGGIFPIALSKDEEGMVSEDKEEKQRYLSARNRDHLISPFQCDECHFRNLIG